MAFAMAFPVGLPRGRGKCSQIREHLSKTQENYISQARFVLRNNPPALFANVHRRHLTKGQQAMAVALAYPDPEKGGRGKRLKNSNVFEGIDGGNLSRARFVLRHCLEKAEEVLSNPHYPLTKAATADAHARG